MSLENFITQFGGVTEKYTFYNGEVELRYDVENHEYLLVKDGQLIPQEGVTTICHIIDKSNALIPWACKMMAEKLIRIVPTKTDIVESVTIPEMSFEEFVNLVNESKSAHKEKLEEAADIGHIAHAWIERYINAVLAGDEEAKYRALGEFPSDEKARNCCTAALDWMQRHNVRWISTERKIYSRKHGYAGTMDGKAIVDSCDNPLCCGSPFKDRLSVIDWKSSNYLYIEYLYQTAAYEAADEEEFGEDITDRWIIRLGKTDGEFEPWHVEEDHFQDDFNGFLTALEMYRSVHRLEERMNLKKRWIKDELKKIKKAEKEAQLKIKCAYADKYKGTRKPNCNKGNPCQTCLQKYELVQKAKFYNEGPGIDMSEVASDM